MDVGTNFDFDDVVQQQQQPQPPPPPSSSLPVPPPSPMTTRTTSSTTTSGVFSSFSPIETLERQYSGQSSWLQQQADNKNKKSSSSSGNIGGGGRIFFFLKVNSSCLPTGGVETIMKSHHHYQQQQQQQQYESYDDHHHQGGGNNNKLQHSAGVNYDQQQQPMSSSSLTSQESGASAPAGVGGVDNASTMPADPFSFLSQEEVLEQQPTPTPAQQLQQQQQQLQRSSSSGSGGGGGGGVGIGRFFKKVAKSTTKSLERGVQQLAIRANQGRHADILIAGLYTSDSANYPNIIVDPSTTGGGGSVAGGNVNNISGNGNERLLYMTEPQSIRAPSTNDADDVGGGVRFVLPLILNFSNITGDTTSVIIKLWIRSGVSTMLVQTVAKFATKTYLLGMSIINNVQQLKQQLIMMSATTSSSQAQQQQPYVTYSVPLHSSYASSSSSSPQIQLCITSDMKFPYMNRPGWSLTDPTVPTGYVVSSTTMSKFHNLPLDQTYLLLLQRGGKQQQHGSSGTNNNHGTTWLIGNERTIESTVVLPIACAVADMVSAACDVSYIHSQSVAQICLSDRYDIATSIPKYIPTIAINDYDDQAQQQGQQQQQQVFTTQQQLVEEYADCTIQVECIQTTVVNSATTQLLTSSRNNSVVKKNNNTNQNSSNNNNNNNGGGGGGGFSPTTTTPSMNLNNNNNGSGRSLIISAYWQRPDVIFEVQVMPPTKITLLHAHHAVNKQSQQQQCYPHSFRFFPKPCRVYEDILPSVLRKLQQQQQAASAAANSTNSSGTGVGSGGCGWPPEPAGFLLGNVRFEIATTSIAAGAGAAVSGGELMNGSMMPPSRDIWEAVLPLESALVSNTTTTTHLHQHTMGRPIHVPVYNTATGQPMGTLILSAVSIGMVSSTPGPMDTPATKAATAEHQQQQTTAAIIQQQQPQAQPQVLSSWLSKGLVSVMGLSSPTNDQDGIQPKLDFDDNVGMMSSTIQMQQQQQQQSPTANTASTAAQQLDYERRKHQLQTMGQFISFAYIDHHNKKIRSVDTHHWKQRSLQYNAAIAMQQEATTGDEQQQQTTTTSTMTATSGHQQVLLTAPNKDRSPKPFRPSSSRSDVILAGIPFNVHTATMTCQTLIDNNNNNNGGGGAVNSTTTTNNAVFYNTTCGCPSDHARGFGNVFAERQQQQQQASSSSSSSQHQNDDNNNNNTVSLNYRSMGLVSPIGPASGGLRRLERKRSELAGRVSSLQTALIMSIANYFVEQRQHTTQSIRTVNHVHANHMELQSLRWKVFESVQSLHHITWTCAIRRATVFSQALGIAMNAFLLSLTNYITSQQQMQQQGQHQSNATTGGAPSWLPDVWIRHGYLISYEGLLSAAGKELGMIEDASVGIGMLSRVHIVLVPHDEPEEQRQQQQQQRRVPVPHSPYLRWIQVQNYGQYDHTTYTVRIGFLSTYYEQCLPAVLKNTRNTPIRIYPLLFEVGVDIRQWGAHAGSHVKSSMVGSGSGGGTAAAAATTTSSTEPSSTNDPQSGDDDDDQGMSDDDVLVQLNYEAFQKMNAYAHALYPVNNQQQQQQQQQRMSIHPNLATLYQHIANSAGKMNHEIVVEAAYMAQQLGGGGVVFCKSGKDRTAMHVTYKQAAFVQQSTITTAATAAGGHQQQQQQQQQDGNNNNSGSGISSSDMASLMRVHGTRLPICEKNVGQAKYAFNSLQVKFMPDALRPPSNTLAGFLKGGKVFTGGGIES